MSVDPDTLTGAGARWLVESDVRIAVVGAGGWMGLASLELLHRLLGPAAFQARVVAFGSQRRTLALRGGVCVEQQVLDALTALTPRPSLVLHLAFLTQEKARTMSEADYVAANTSISRRVREALDGIGAVGVFTPSSGAAYRVDDDGAPAAMRLYGRLKREDEATFAGWAAQVPGRRAVIARVFNLSGPYINKQDSYALACFIADALDGRPISVKATRPAYRSYVAISELMSVVFGVLGEAHGGSVVFDTAGDRDYEMDDIAAAVAEALGGAQGVRRPALMSQTPDLYLGDGAAYRLLRQRFAVEPVDFRSQIQSTARFMAAERDPGVGSPSRSFNA